MKIKESETVELKKSTSELKEAIISIASILNKHGKGRLYFGIKNDGIVIGQQVGVVTLREISKAIADHIEPKIYPKVQIKVIQGKSCIFITFEGDDSPYFAYGRAYMRVADSDRQLSIKELENLIIKKQYYRSKWESEVSEIGINQASVQAIRNFVKRANNAGRMSYDYDNAHNILNKLGLIKGANLLNAGKALFCYEDNVEVQAAVFAGNDKITFLDIQSFHGNLFELIKKSESYLKEHINWRADLSGSRRKEIPEIPVRAISEAIINSLCHRDFANPKGNEIAIFKNRIEIYNPGRFPEEHSPEDYIRGDERSVLRNPLIAHAFYLTSDIERWGSGLKRIYNACKEARVKFEFKNLKSGFLVIFYRPGIKIGKVPERVLEKVPEKVLEKITDNQQKILNSILANKHVTISELAVTVGISERKIRENIRKLKNKGLLKRVGPDKGGYWKSI